MSLSVLNHAQNKLTHIIGLIFLCVAYFNNSLVAEPVAVFFQISHFTGQILVNKFFSVCKFTVEAVRLIYSFFEILYEDSVIFVKDATEKFTLAIYILKYIYLCLEELGWSFVRIISAVGQAIINAVGVLHYTFGSVKYGIQITGSTIWKFLTQAPETVILKINAINIFITNTFKDLISSVFTFFDKILEWLGKIYLFFFDIPLDSVYGLIIGALLITILYVKFHDICVIISSAAVKFYNHIVQLGVSLWTGRFLERRSEMDYDYGPEDDERLCVVCQYQAKEIIIFPCKHLCLCGNCSSQLAKIRPSCPVCRSKIEGTLKVYL